MNNISLPDISPEQERLLCRVAAAAGHRSLGEYVAAWLVTKAARAAIREANKKPKRPVGRPKKDETVKAVEKLALWLREAFSARRAQFPTTLEVYLANYGLEEAELEKAILLRDLFALQRLERERPWLRPLKPETLLRTSDTNKEQLETKEVTTR